MAYDPPSARQLLDLARRRAEAGAEARGLRPEDIFLCGPLVPAEDIFGTARRGYRRRQAAYVRARRAEEEPSNRPKLPPLISALDGETWLKLRLRLPLPPPKKLMALAWKGRGPAGPGGTRWHAVAQALQIHGCATDIAHVLGLGPAKEEPSPTLGWVRRQLEEWAVVDPNAIRSLGLEPLQQAVFGAAGSLEVFATACGFGGVTRNRSTRGCPPDIPLIAFATWLFAAGAEPMEVAAIADAVGIRPCPDRDGGSRAMARLKREFGVEDGEVSPVRFLASLAIQRLQIAEEVPSSGGSLVPPLPFPPPGPAPEWERRGEWVMVPIPAWALGFGFLNGLLQRADGEGPGSR